MHEHLIIFVTALLLLIYGLFSKLSERSPVTGPMFFLGVGIIIGPLGLDIFKLHFSTPGIIILVEITLTIILFVDASKIRQLPLKTILSGIPARLLLIGLPLSIIIGTSMGLILFPESEFWIIALIALILSPTDAALGQLSLQVTVFQREYGNRSVLKAGLTTGSYCR